MNRRAFFRSIAHAVLGAASYVYAGPLVRTPSLATEDYWSETQSAITQLEGLLFRTKDGSLAFNLNTLREQGQRLVIKDDA